MNDLRWIVGLVRRRTLALAGAATALAMTMAFAAALGSFVVQSRTSLASRAAAHVAADWQVELRTPADIGAAIAQLRSTVGVRDALPVEYARIPGLRASTDGGDRTTGSTVVVGLPPDYGAQFPQEIRRLLGSGTGVLLQQQTASNLGVTAGSRFTAIGPTATLLTVDGVVDLPAADSFFQTVGAGTAATTAPPDNVLLVPAGRFAAITAGLPTTTQLHVAIDHGSLPRDPAAAANDVAGRVRHVEAALAGAGTVGDNLGAALLGARQDALYAQLLVLLLGAPGIVLGVLVVVLVVALRGERRRREVDLLRLRGASTARLLRLAGWEALLVGAAGALLALPIALLAIRLALPRGTGLSPGWTIAATVGGLVVALATQLVPVVGASRTTRARRDRLPVPLRYGLDLVLLAAAGLVFALTARGGYQVVVVPEGIPTASVNYGALLAPLLAWPGLGLLVWRLTIAAHRLRTGRFARHAGGAPELEAAVVRRRRVVLGRGATGLAVALALALSTAAFTRTYDRQANLDVALTVGADVAVTRPADAVLPGDVARSLAAAPGVRAVEPMQHRLAYVGSDLQDLYGIDPTTIGRAAPLRDSFVPGSTIGAALRSLASTPDGVLLSAETVHDYQLHPGDPIRLRLQDPRHAYVTVPFRVIGVVTEFPTAPRDSFIVANAAYVARATGNADVATYLAASRDPAATAAAVGPRLPAGAVVHDTVHDRATVTSASGLAGADLSGLARLELGFGVLLALAFAGLVLVLGLTERTRSFVVLGALGATPRQRSRFAAAETRAVVVPGIAGGIAVGTALALLLVRLLNGIFDPPPSSVAVPWTYGLGLVATTVVVVVLLTSVAVRRLGRGGLRRLRD